MTKSHLRAAAMKMSRNPPGSNSSSIPSSPGSTAPTTTNSNSASHAQQQPTFLIQSTPPLDQQQSLEDQLRLAANGSSHHQHAQHQNNPQHAHQRQPPRHRDSFASLSSVPRHRDSFVSIQSSIHQQTPPRDHHQLHRPPEPDDKYEGHFQYITDRILVASQPPLPPPESNNNDIFMGGDDWGADDTDADLSGHDSLTSAGLFWNQVETMSVGVQNMVAMAPTPYWQRVSSFLEERQFIWLALDGFDNDEDENDNDNDHNEERNQEQIIVQQYLHGQVIQLPWEAAGHESHTSSSTPTLGTLLRICYAVHAWLEQGSVVSAKNESNRKTTNKNNADNSVVVLACRNGQTKTALAAAAVLRYLNQVPLTQHGFCHFVTCTRDSTTLSSEHQHQEALTTNDGNNSGDAALKLWEALPPSVRNVLTHLDDVLERGTSGENHYIHKYPLRLKALSVQGIPVEEKPCIEIYNVQGKVLYASHPHVYGNAHTQKNNNNLPPTTSYWIDDEGLYRVEDDAAIGTDSTTNSSIDKRDVLLQGDFCIVGRFGGVAHEHDAAEPSKWLFRYVQSTAFLDHGSGIIELPRNRVDLMRRYEEVMPDFLLTLVVEPYWKTAQNGNNPNKKKNMMTPCGPHALPPLYPKGTNDAMEEGWRLLTQHHFHQPNIQDVHACQQQYGRDLNKCPLHFIKLALQLAQGHVVHAHALLSFGFLQPWWTSPPAAVPKLPLKLPPVPKTLTWQVPPKEKDLSSTPPTTGGSEEDKSTHLQEEQTLLDAVELLDDLVAGMGSGADPADGLLGDVQIPDPFDIAKTTSVSNLAALSSSPPKIGGEQINSTAQKTALPSKASSDGSTAADPRAGLMAAIAAKTASSTEKESSGDHRAGLMSAIAAKAGAAPAKKKQTNDPRSGLMAAIAAKAGSAPAPGKKEEPPADPRAGLMAAIAAKAGSAPAPAKKEAPADPRAGLMAAIANKAKKEEEAPADPRAGLMAAIAAKAGSAPAPAKKEAPADPRAGLMAAIANKAKMEEEAPADPRAGLMAAIAAKAGSAPAPAKKEAPADPRAGLMAAIANKAKKEEEAPADPRAGLMAAIAAKAGSAPAPAKKEAPADPRAGLMAAIANKAKKEEEAPADPRAGLMAAIAAKAGSAPAPAKKEAPADPRAGLMAAIANKAKKEEEAPADPRAGLMAAIAAKAGSAPAPAKKEAPADPRAGLMAAIANKAKKEEKPPAYPRAGLMAAIAAKAGSAPAKKLDASPNPELTATSREAKKEDYAAEVASKSSDALEKQTEENQVGPGIAKNFDEPSTKIEYDKGDPIEISASSTMSARVGDVYGSLVPAAAVWDPSQPLPDGLHERPILPLLPVGQPHLHIPLVGSLDDPSQREAVELLLKLQHVGVTLDDLTNLMEVSQFAWNQTQTTQVGDLQESEKDAVGDTVDNASTLSNPNEAKGEDNPTSSSKTDPEKSGKSDDVAAHSSPQEEKKEESSQEKESQNDTNPPMKKDKRFEKYFKMRNVGLPDGAIKNAMSRDEVDPSILDLDWDKNYEEQTGKPEASASDSGNDGPSMKEDDRFKKYWKMKSVGLPDGAVAQAMMKDGLDPKDAELDWDKNYEAQTQPAVAEVPSGPPMKEDDRFKKYWKMKSVGLPDGAVAQAMMKDGLDPKDAELDWDKNYEAQTQPAVAEVPSGPPMKEDDRFKKYWKMKSVGLPDGAVAQAMMKDGLDPKDAELDWDKNYEAQTQPAVAEVPSGPPMKEDDRFKKYWKMKSVGLPDGAVAQAMMKDGVDPKAAELDWDKNYEAQTQPAVAADTGPPLKDDPTYAKYFKMLSVGLPPPVVQNAMTRDGIDPKILDLDPEKSVASQLKPDTKKTPIKKKKKVRRKKIYWTPIDPGQLKDDSLWSIVKGKLSMKKLNYDVKEFEALFTESADPADKKKKQKKKGGEKKEKKAQQVIDGKRSMNGGIILARLRMAYNAIASMVDKMQMGSFDATQLKALKDFLPTAEERGGLDRYMSKANTDEKKQALYADLSECEKYMHTMIGVEKADQKFDCMIFKSGFDSRFDELMEAMKLIETACDEVRNSEKLQKLMTLILVLVNEINTGGESQGAAEGFNLEALLKLDEAKAFDKKTSVLHYLVKLIMHNDSALVEFISDLKHSKEAVNLTLDSLVGDMKELRGELEAVVDIAREDAERAEEAGERTFSLQDLRGQRTSVHLSTAGVPQFNHVDHHTGRTPMERFTIHAGASIQQAIEFADNIQAKYVKLLQYFGEDEQMGSDDFFRTLNSFIDVFRKAQDKVEKDEKARKKAEEKQKKQEAKKRKEEEKKRLAEEKKPKKEAEERGDQVDLVASLAFEDAPKENDTAGSRAGLVAAISANGEGSDSPADPRAGLMAAIAAKAGSAPAKKEAPADRRAGLMAAIANKAKKEEEAPADPRAGLMAAIAAKAGSAPAPAKKEAPADPRAGLMAAIANKAKKEEEAPADPRAGLMAAIAAKAGSAPAPAKKEAPADPRAGLMAAIANKAKKEEKPPADPRAGLMAAIAAKAGSAPAPAKKEAPADPRAGLMAAIANKAKKEEEAPADPRAGLMAAIAAKAGSAPAPAKKQAPADPRAGLMAAIANKAKKEEEAPADPRAGLMAAIAAKAGSAPAPAKKEAPADPRAGLMAAIANKAKKEEEAPADPRAGLMAAIAAKAGSAPAPAKKEAPAEARAGLMAAIANKAKKEEEPPADPRAGLMAAIANKAKKEEEPPADPRAGLMAAIAAKSADKSKTSGKSVDPRSGLLAAISARSASASGKKLVSDKPTVVAAVSSGSSNYTSEANDSGIFLLPAVPAKEGGKDNADDVVTRCGDSEQQLPRRETEKGKTANEELNIQESGSPLIAKENGGSEVESENLPTVSNLATADISSDPKPSVTPLSASIESFDAKMDRIERERKGAIVESGIKPSNEVSEEAVAGNGVEKSLDHLSLGVKGKGSLRPKTSFTHRAQSTGSAGFMMSRPGRSPSSNRHSIGKSRLQRAGSQSDLFALLAADETIDQVSESSAEDNELHKHEFDDVGVHLPADLGPLGTEGEEITRLQMKMAKKPYSRDVSISRTKAAKSSDPSTRRFSAI